MLALLRQVCGLRLAASAVLAGFRFKRDRQYEDVLAEAAGPVRIGHQEAPAAGADLLAEGRPECGAAAEVNATGFDGVRGSVVEAEMDVCLRLEILSFDPEDEGIF